MTDKLYKKISFTTALSLLLMAIIAPIAVFGILEAQGPKSAQDLQIAGSIFILIAFLDILVGWGVRWLFKSENPELAELSGWLRILYGSVLLLSTTPLFIVATNPATMVQVDSAILTFQWIWDIGLFLFGMHMMLLGILVFRSPNFSRILGILVIITGLAYTIDSILIILGIAFPVVFGEYLFFGEILFMLWLFYRAIKGLRN